MPGEDDKKTTEGQAGDKAPEGTKEEGTAGKAAQQPSLDDVVSAVRFLAGQSRETQRQLKELQESKAAPIPETKPEPKPQDLEAMTRAEFAEFITDRIKDSLVQPVEKRVAANEEQVTGRSVREEMKQAEQTHPDFWEWRDEMAGVARRYPDLTVEEVYVLAKSSSREKAEKIDAKLKKEAEEKAEAEGEEGRRERFGGLLPTSGRTTRSRRMDKQTAADKAWEQSGMSRHLKALSDE